MNNPNRTSPVQDTFEQDVDETLNVDQAMIESTLNIAARMAYDGSYGLTDMVDAMRDAIYDRARELNKKGMSQKDIACLLDITPSALSQAFAKQLKKKKSLDKDSAVIDVAQFIELGGEEGVSEIDLYKLTEKYCSDTVRDVANRLAIKKVISAEKRKNITWYKRIAGGQQYTEGFGNKELSNVFSKISAFLKICAGMIEHLDQDKGPLPNSMLRRQRNNLADDPAFMDKAIKALDDLVLKWGEDWEKKSHDHISEKGGSLKSNLLILASSNNVD